MSGLHTLIYQFLKLPLPLHQSIASLPCCASSPRSWRPLRFYRSLCDLDSINYYVADVCEGCLSLMVLTEDRLIFKLLMSILHSLEFDLVFVFHREVLISSRILLFLILLLILDCWGEIDELSLIGLPAGFLWMISSMRRLQWLLSIVHYQSWLMMACLGASLLALRSISSHSLCLRLL